MDGGDGLMGGKRGWKKGALELALFLAVLVLTFRTMFGGQKIGSLLAAIGRLTPVCTAAAVLLGLLFVCLEGFMIWLLLTAMGGKSGLGRCVGYSFVGFFYSGITPSATGGQPMQLLYMKRDGNRVEDSTVVLMVVALCYKLALVCIGAVLLIGWRERLVSRMGGSFGLYLLGMLLNTLLVLLLLGVMGFPQVMRRTAGSLEGLLVRAGFWKQDSARMERTDRFVESYRRAVQFLRAHPGRLAAVLLCTFVQRCTVFVLTWMIYLGFGLTGTGGGEIAWLQAAVYLAVDMLPVPGAQGVTELLYKKVFSGIFPAGLLLPAMLASRAAGFYLPLLFGLAAAAGFWMAGRRGKDKERIAAA
ncbi:MAG: lysylphosphatidylglycerol synthase transmembrane domain-containing protein [Eubacteriales bacterium]|nr:lysylphosphatidylglycerol synthase transmembrane domain-containing protein [Eubacteriales bacterium]